MENNWTYAWNGKADDALEKLFDLYHEKFGCTPDTYAGILYSCMTYEEFTSYIRECLEKNLEIPDVVV